MELHLNENEQAALYQLAQASGKDVEQYLHDVVRGQLATEIEEEAAISQDFQEWQRRLNACIARHPMVGHVDTSRASIYGERR